MLMRFISTVSLAVLLFLQVRSQSSCKRSSALFQFDPHVHPRLFTEKLGNHPQFPFLQYENGVVSRALFIKAAKDPQNGSKYKAAFDVFDRLLKDIGFPRGYKDLKGADVENLFINPGTIGNLGFFNKESNYIYVRLNPAGEGDDGIAAWKITGPGGCSFYVLHTCGNAFFSSDPGSGAAGCCKEIGVMASTDTIRSAASAQRPLHLKIQFYQGTVSAGKKRGQYDTLYRLVRSIDTVAMLKDSLGRPVRIFGNAITDKWVLCRDTVLSLRLSLTVDSSMPASDLVYSKSDTLFVRMAGEGVTVCRKKWEIALDGGASVNSIPRYDNTTQHTRTNGFQPVAALSISRIFNHWFQAGISAAYMTLSYQDDNPYPGSAPNTYNIVYPGKPIIPVQLFGKATIGGPLGWQATVSLSAGYSFVPGDKITNSGNTLGVKPSTKGGPTAGVGIGIAYFFDCRWGLALSASGQYFDNKATTMTYHLVALPVSLGLRYRF
jgi:hypothetical protein